MSKATSRRSPSGVREPTPLPNLAGYAPGAFYDEMFEATGVPRPASRPLAEEIDALGAADIRSRQEAAEKSFRDAAVTFNVYGGIEGIDRIFPFDLVPRVVGAAEWRRIEAGLRQRVEALNLFLEDIYGAGKILRDGVIPSGLVASSANYLEACRGIRPPRGIYCHVTGTDLVRDTDGLYYVLEDNLQCPSGVSYVLENRRILKAVFSPAFRRSRVCPVSDYPSHLLAALESLAPGGPPTVVLLTPGMHNSAYFEHTLLAREMGIELVEGRDLAVVDGEVVMRTTRGRERIDVIYRRIEDAWLDPSLFRQDSVLGVPGLFEAYRTGTVALANAPGGGVADDKAVYAYAPKIIRYYLGEDALLPNVPTWVCFDEKECAWVIENLEKLVVKRVDGAGGYGMLIGPQSTRAQREDFRNRILADPRGYIAQPTLALSTVPVLIDGHLEGRHVDLRPYTIYGEDGVYVLPGALTRVALKEGSLVVNSSQGGGSKDTWVLAD
jgi:uncharacterized circularly permuted ATP-grasp superfamily protein